MHAHACPPKCCQTALAGREGRACPSKECTTDKKRCHASLGHLVHCYAGLLRTSCNRRRYRWPCELPVSTVLHTNVGTACYTMSASGSAGNSAADTERCSAAARSSRMHSFRRPPFLALKLSRSSLKRRMQAALPLPGTASATCSQRCESSFPYFFSACRRAMTTSQEQLPAVPHSGQQGCLKDAERAAQQQHQCHLACPN